MTTLDQTHSAADLAPEAQEASRRFKLPLAPALESRRIQCYLTLIVLDTLAIFGSFLFVDYLYFGEVNSAATDNFWIGLIPMYLTAALGLRAYSLPSLVGLRKSQNCALMALLAAFTLSLLIAFFARSSSHYSRFSTAGGVAVSAMALLWLRAAAQPLIRMIVGPTAENVLVFDDGGLPVRVPHAWHIDTREHRLAPDRDDPHMLDRLGLFMTNMDRVLVSCPPERRLDWAFVFKGSNISGEIIDAEVTKLGVLGARRGHGFGALIVSTGPLGVRARIAKRAMDVAIAGSALLFLAPLLVTVGLLIRLEDRGPMFFMQQRQGRNNRLFWIYKFRSMRVERLDAAGTRSASKDDDRITRTGRFIRRTSIDELPQLINVLKGDMSIVGPRPHAIGSLAGQKRFWEVDPRYLMRHSLKPGLTGLAQIRGLRGATDSEADLSNRLQADLEYLDGWTVLRDIRIMFATISVLIHERAF
jgi:lipopolysaccharide/colanic/teichoic acid biosynthesis glycosyltransferase